MILAVVIAAQAPNGRFHFSAARPENFPGCHEAQRHPGKLLRATAAFALSVCLRRIGEFRRALVKAPGAFGVGVSAPHYGFLPALLQAGKQSERGIAQQFKPSFLSAFDHVEKLVEGGITCPTNVFPISENRLPRIP